MHKPVLIIGLVGALALPRMEFARAPIRLFSEETSRG